MLTLTVIWFCIYRKGFEAFFNINVHLDGAPETEAA